MNSTKTEQVIEAIGRRIVEGKYNAGEALPSEAKLCEEFNLSRSVIREALRALVTKKLIENTPYKGATVLPTKRWNYLDSDVLNWALLQKDNTLLLTSLIEVRTVFETTIARWAAKRATSYDLAAMESAFDDMKLSVHNKEAFYNADLRFHQAILASTKNLILQQLNTALCSLQKALFASSWSSIAQDKTATFSAHEMLLNAIRHRDEQAAASATIELTTLMTINISQSVQALLATLPQEDGRSV